jgi:hypothetical protein
MFLTDESKLHICFATTRARLAALTRDGGLTSVSARAYGEGFIGLARTGPFGPMRGLSRLVMVHFGAWVDGDGSATLPLRWQATGPSGGLFPALDANITLTPDGEESTMIRLDGAYRPPLGRLGARIDEVVLHQVAKSTIHSFITQIADGITSPPGSWPPTPRARGGPRCPRGPG